MSASLGRVLFNGRYLTRAPTGVDRFAIELLKALARRHPIRSLRLAVPEKAMLYDVEATGADIVRVGRRNGHAWEQIDLPRAAGADALISLCNTAPLLRERQMVVIHDLGTVANASNYTWAFRRWYGLMHSAVVRRSRVVATVSRFSAGEIAMHFGMPSNGIEVIHEGGEHILAEPADRSVLARLGLEDRRYVLALGSRSANKNFSAVREAVKLLGDPDLLLVAAGGSNARIYKDAENVDDGVIATGYIGNGELRALYEGAVCFAFPSFYEGFGLPPLEAMWCNCPVIVSDRASLPEVCGDAALYCRPEDPATLTAALRDIIDSPSRRQELQQAGRERAATFGWDKAAAHFEQLLDAHFA